MRYQFVEERSDLMEERPFSDGLSWFVLVLVVLFFLGFYSIVLSFPTTPHHSMIDTTGITQSGIVELPE